MLNSHTNTPIVSKRSANDSHCYCSDQRGDNPRVHGGKVEGTYHKVGCFPVVARTGSNFLI